MNSLALTPRGSGSPTGTPNPAQKLVERVKPPVNMAHPEQSSFIQKVLACHPQAVTQASKVLEVGSQDINGSIRSYFPDASEKTWLGIDLGPAPGVDLVIPGELLQLPDGWANLAFSTECFEHAVAWSQILLNMIRCTTDGGLILFTCAGPGRPTHGTLDTDANASPFTTQYYKNLSPADFLSAIDMNFYFSKFAFEVDSGFGDTYFWGVRNANVAGTEYGSTEESLARARGQLSVAIERNLELERQCKYLKSHNSALGEELAISKSGTLFALKLARKVKNLFH